MQFNVNVSGLRFRATDGLMTHRQIGDIVAKRLSGNGGAGCRAGDRVKRGPNGPVLIGQMAEMQLKKARKGGDVKATLHGDIIPTCAQDISAQMRMIKVPGKKLRVAELPITTAQFRVFLKATGYIVKGDGREALVSEPIPSEINYPASLSFHDAQAYLKWLNSQAGRQLRVPTKEESCSFPDRIDNILWEFRHHTTQGGTENFDLLTSTTVDDEGKKYYEAWSQGGNPSYIWLNPNQRGGGHNKCVVRIVEDIQT